MVMPSDGNDADETHDAGQDAKNDPIGHDPGLAGARTSLAWERTGLSLFACGIAIARDIPVGNGRSGQPVLGGIILALGAMVSFTSSRQARRRATHFGTTRPAATLDDLAPLTMAITLVGVAGTVIAVW